MKQQIINKLYNSLTDFDSIFTILSFHFFADYNLVLGLPVSSPHVVIDSKLYGFHILLWRLLDIIKKSRFCQHFRPY
jgi:hypothetical protein